MISEASVQYWIFSYSVYINWMVIYGKVKNRQDSFQRHTIHLNPRHVSVKPEETRWNVNGIRTGYLLRPYRASTGYLSRPIIGTATPVAPCAFIFIFIILYKKNSPFHLCVIHSFLFYFHPPFVVIINFIHSCITCLILVFYFINYFSYNR